MSANAAKDLVREAMLYDQLGHRAEGRALLRYAHTVCPAAPELQRAEAQLARPERSRLPGALSIDVVDVAQRRVVWTGSVDLPRTRRGGEREALEASLVRLMGAMPRRGVEP